MNALTFKQNLLCARIVLYGMTHCVEQARSTHYIPVTEQTIKLYAQHLMKTNSLIKEAAASIPASNE
ncbi:hypothetical protein E2C01_016762 [Portunus trituberculatus]|uniref:Uncharacterized protein n=1 Tax=Portunus trituberculatus TaxID=210409 RepID=A0A5B7DRT4_PORTR|nr:hypothetical protein [Portunus trituberculatus]